LGEQLGFVWLAGDVGFDRIRRRPDFACCPIGRLLSGAAALSLNGLSRSGYRHAGLGAGLGLERVEGFLGAQELGHGGVAIAHHGLDAPGAVAVADQGEPEAAAVVQAPEVE
jgi:hypothetical protein